MEGRLVVRMPDEQKRVYEETAKVRGLSLSDLVRTLLDEASGVRLASIPSKPTKIIKTVQDIPKKESQRLCYCIYCKAQRAKGSSDTCGR